MLLCIIGALTSHTAAAAVGRIAGNFSVNRTGAAIYSIPISVPAGQYGLKPNIALTYNSQTKSGLAGVGWSITGLSQIHRCGLIIALDGYFQGVRYSKEDRYCLDGQPLIQITTGNYWGGGQEYRTEVHSYEKVLSVGSVGSGDGISPQYFEVHQPNGLIYRYGYTGNSRVEAPGNANSAVRSWALSEIRDQFNERIFFTYEEITASGEFRPTEIKWSGQTAAEAKYGISFVYEARPADDVRSGYEWGSIWTRNKRLKSIEYAYNGVRVHNYALTYVTTGSTKRSKLATITQCGPVGSPTDCLPPTNVNWQTGVDSFGVEITGPTTPDYTDAVFIDLVGDGRTDMVVPKMMSGTNWWNWYSSSTGGIFVDTLPLAQVYGSAGAHQLRDFNGDGSEDLMVEGADGDWHVIYINQSQCGMTWICNVDTGISVAQNSLVVPLDVNGDGRTDLVVHRSDTTYLRINTGATFGPEQTTSVSLTGDGTEFYQWFEGFTDVNGDGREDLIVRSVHLIRCPPSCFVLMTVTAHLSYWDAAAEQDDFDSVGVEVAKASSIEGVFPVEINGDGLTDFAYSEAGIWKTVLSTGSDITAAVTATGISFGSIASDIDNDGRTDLIAPCGLNWCAYTSDGTTYSSTRKINLGGPNPIYVNRISFQDTSGDGYADFLAVKTTSPTNGWKIRLHDGPRADLVDTITDGLGNVEVVAYATAHVDKFGKMDVVLQHTAPNGRNTDYSFGASGFSSDGRGFLGFGTVTITDSVDSTYITTIYRQDFPYISLPDMVTRYQPDGKRIFQFNPSWDNYPLIANGDTYYFVHLAQSPDTSSITDEYEVDSAGSSNGLLTRSTTRKVLYNFTHGAIRQDVTTVSSPAHSTDFLTTVDTTFKGFGSNTWCLGFPEQVDVKKSDTTAPEQIRTVQNTYTPQCRTKTTRSGPAGVTAQQQLTTYGYATNGNLTSITRDAGDGGLPDRVTTFGWDADGYRQTSITQKINAPDADLTVAQTWNYGLGLLETQTDPRNNLTRWTYDDFGRLIQQDAPGPAATTVSYQNCGCFVGTAVYKVRSDLLTTGAWSETYHDGYGRQVGQASVLVDGAISRQSTSYDLKGRVTDTDVPYVVGDPFFSTGYSYDYLDRVTQINRPVSELTTLTYDRLSVTVQDAEQHSTTYNHDAESRLVSVLDALSNTANYTYWPFGEVRQVITDATITMTYDALGNPDSVDDLDSGVWNYDYNVFGELIQQTDDMSPINVITLTYDQFGRLRTRTELEGSTVWDFYQSGTGLGLLKNVTGPAGFSETHSYNGLGRLISTTTTINSFSHTMDYDYNAVGQLNSMTYPAYPVYSSLFGRPQFTYTYSRGHLDTILDARDNNVLIYDVKNQDALGRETLTTFGIGTNAVDQQMIYNPATGRLSDIKTGAGLGADVQNYSYQWDKVGNLKQRQDNNQSITENFGYDQLYRLTTVTLGSQTTSLTYTPNGNGNIEWKSDVGTYTYGENGAGPHAVTTISGTRADTYYYDKNGNMNCRGASTSACSDGDTITWTSFNKPLQINYGSDYASFVYGPNRQRITQGSSTRQIYYAGNHFEWEVESFGASTTMYRYRSTVYANGRAVYWLQEHVTDTGCSVNSGTEGYFLFRDHQGSVDRMLADGAGTGSDQMYSFDAFGKRRNVTGWTADTNDTLLNTDHLTKRGYTGHEHLDNVRLIHMNGRVQDPIMGRMISVDPLVNLLNPQSINPYSYVYNNSPSLVDSSGYGPDTDWPDAFCDGYVVFGSNSCNLGSLWAAWNFQAAWAQLVFESQLEEWVQSLVNSYLEPYQEYLGGSSPSGSNGNENGNPQDSPVPRGTDPSQRDQITESQCNETLINFGNRLASFSADAADVSGTLILTGLTITAAGVVTAQPEVFAAGVALTATGGVGGVVAGSAQVAAGISQGLGGADFSNAGNALISLGTGGLLSKFIRGPAPTGHRSMSQRAADTLGNNAATVTGGVFDTISSVFEQLGPQQKTCSR